MTRTIVFLLCCFFAHAVYGEIVCDVNVGAYYAIYDSEQQSCSQGYYLPAGTSWNCTKCLPDNYCPGGTYSFDTSTSRGMTSCPNEHPFSPAGMWAETQCGRKLHVGNDVVYLHRTSAAPTQHKLYIKNGDTTYYANATLDQTGNSNLKMSVGAANSLRININGAEYVIHDDSVN